MSDNDMENPREDEQSEDQKSDMDEPILLTEEVSLDDDDEEVIDLTEEVLPGDDDEEIIELTEEVPADADDDDNVIDLVEVVEDEDDVAVSNVPADLPEDGIQISPAQLDKAIEKTVEKIYGDRIENLLIDAVQKKVSAEIEKIKKTLSNI